MTADRQPAAESKIFNVPNQVTAARLVLAILVFVFIPLKMFWTAAVLFAVAAGTDWLDGWWARRYNQVTKLGRIFDPFVDKIIICGTFIFLAAEYPASGVAAWMAVVVVAREMLVTALRGFIEQQGGDFSANMPGKLKMVFQCAAVLASLVTLTYGDAVGPEWLEWTLLVTVWLAVLSTIYSGILYIFAAARFLRE